MNERTARTAATPLQRGLELRSCLACGQLSEVTGSFSLPGPGGDEPYLRTRCLDGHLVVVPEFAVPA